MKTSIRFLFAPMGIATALALGAGPAGATCYDIPQAMAGHAGAAAVHVPPNWSTPPAAGTQDPADGRGLAGLWKITFLDSNGNPVGFAYQAFGDGGTDTLLDMNRSPALGDVCIGVWKAQERPRHYKISHYSPIFDTDNVTFLGTVNWVSEMVLSPDGRTSQENIAFTGYDVNGNILFQADGVATGARVTVNTPVFP
jgi:hypothetical protein